MHLEHLGIVVSNDQVASSINMSMRYFYFLSVIVAASSFFSCNKDCEEPAEPRISFEPHFVSDSLGIWGDWGSEYRRDDIVLKLTSGDTSSVRISLSTSEVIVYPVGEIAQINGAEFNGSISIIDKNVDTTIAIVAFESFLEGGDDSKPCINPLIQSVILRQGSRLLYDGNTSPEPEIYLIR